MPCAIWFVVKIFPHFHDQIKHKASIRFHSPTKNTVLKGVKLDLMSFLVIIKLLVTVGACGSFSVCMLDVMFLRMKLG